MKNRFYFLLIMFFAVSTQAQQTSFKFDFGSGKTASGYIWQNTLKSESGIMNLNHY